MVSITHYAIVTDALAGLLVTQVAFSVCIQVRIILARWGEKFYAGWSGLAVEGVWAAAYSAKSGLIAFAIVYGPVPFRLDFLCAAILIFGVGDWALIQTLRPGQRACDRCGFRVRAAQTLKEAKP
jgi:hypothetical protein